MASANETTCFVGLKLTSHDRCRRSERLYIDVQIAWHDQEILFNLYDYLEDFLIRHLRRTQAQFFGQRLLLIAQEQVMHDPLIQYLHSSPLHLT